MNIFGNMNSELRVRAEESVLPLGPLQVAALLQVSGTGRAVLDSAIWQTYAGGPDKLARLSATRLGELLLDLVNQGKAEVAASVLDTVYSGSVLRVRDEFPSSSDAYQKLMPTGDSLCAYKAHDGLDVWTGWVVVRAMLGGDFTQRIASATWSQSLDAAMEGDALWDSEHQAPNLRALGRSFDQLDRTSAYAQVTTQGFVVPSQP